MCVHNYLAILYFYTLLYSKFCVGTYVLSTAIFSCGTVSLKNVMLAYVRLVHVMFKSIK